MLGVPSPQAGCRGMETPSAAGERTSQTAILSLCLKLMDAAVTAALTFACGCNKLIHKRATRLLKQSARNWCRLQRTPAQRWLCKMLINELNTDAGWMSTICTSAGTLPVVIPFDCTPGNGQICLAKLAGGPGPR